MSDGASAVTLLTNIGQLVTPREIGALRLQAMRDLEITTDAVVAIADGHVVWCGPRSGWTGRIDQEIDAEGCAVVPGLVDPHTHAVWGGDRYADFEARTSGVSYEAILAGGGGIRHTVACTSGEPLDALTTGAESRVRRMIRAGATTIEIKSGYGFTREAEERTLQAIHGVRARVPATIVPTMLFHLPPRNEAERPAYLEDAVHEWIPSLRASGLAAAIDVFVERDAFSLEEAEALLGAARRVGLPCKVHADQFTAMGGTELAIQYSALSVDHLEASRHAQIHALARSATVGVLLPGVTLHLGLPAAPGRELIDTGAAVAVGTDCNPGSSPLFSMSLALALAVRLNGLSPAEALTAATANAAAALGLRDTGRIAPGMRADLLILRTSDWRALPYTLGDDVVGRVFIAGEEYTA